MGVMEIANDLVSLCREGKNLEAIDKLYSSDIESVEPMDMPGMERTHKGIEAVRGKNQWWLDNHEVHGGNVVGPFPHGDRFAILFKFDVTPKQSGQRTTMEEIGIYTVQGNKITKEEFFYTDP